MGSWGRLWVILHREYRTIQTDQSFDRVIVQTHMCDCDVTECCVHHRRSIRKRVDRWGGLDREIVVLRRDLDLPRAEIHDRMVSPMMTKLQFIGVKTQRETENLMP